MNKIEQILRKHLTVELKIGSLQRNYIPEESVPAIASEIEAEPLYEALYNSCIHESDTQTLSVHRTRKGAEMAIEFHKNEQKKIWEDLYKDVPVEFQTPFAQFEWWGVDEIKAQE